MNVCSSADSSSSMYTSRTHWNADDSMKVGIGERHACGVWGFNLVKGC